MPIVNASFSVNQMSPIIANEQAERRQSACEVVSLMPHEILQQVEKFLIVL